MRRLSHDGSQPPAALWDTATMIEQKFTNKAHIIGYMIGAIAVVAVVLIKVIVR